MKRSRRAPRIARWDGCWHLLAGRIEHGQFDTLAEAHAALLALLRRRKAKQRRRSGSRLRRLMRQRRRVGLGLVDARGPQP